MNLKNEIDNKANIWLIKKNEGLSQDEYKELAEWLKNKNHKDAFEENGQLLRECLNLEDEFISEIVEEALSDDNTKNIFFQYKYLLSSVAIIFILILSTLEIDRYFQPSFKKDYLTTNEKILNMSLPDNSTIDIDIKSQLHVRYYKHQRIVNLHEGKALFTVSEDKSRPFIITAGRTLIKVLGTKFEVINLNDITTINVKEGLVKIDYIYDLENEKKKTIIQLKKSETITLDKYGKVLHYDKVDIQKIAYWKKDLIEFNKTTLKDAMILFKRYTNIRVKFENYELSQLTISGKFSTKQYDSFLESIAMIYPIKIIKSNNFINVVNK